MFSFSGRLGRARFLLAAFIRVALFAATVFGFPYILYGVAQATDCARVGGACGAVALIASMALKPLFFILLVLSLIRISVRRARDAGLPPAVGLVIPVLVAADFPFGLFAGAHWSFAFSVGALGVAFPWYLAMALVATIALGAMPPRDHSTPPSGALAWMAELPPVPLWLLPIAALAACGAVFVHMPYWPSGVTLFIALLPMVIPTFAIYAALAYGIWCVVQRQNATAKIVLAAASTPFFAYAYALVSDPVHRHHEAAALGAIKTETLKRAPNVLVFQAANTNGMFGLLGVQGIIEVIADGPYGATRGMVSYTGRRDPKGMLDLPKVDALPAEYLLLKVGAKSAFAGQPFRNGSGGPFELRSIAPGRDDLIGVWYNTDWPSFAIPPVLTMHGWNRGFTMTAPRRPFDAALRDFLEQSIAKALPPPRQAGLDR